MTKSLPSGQSQGASTYGIKANTSQKNFLGKGKLCNDTHCGVCTGTFNFFGCGHVHRRTAQPWTQHDTRQLRGRPPPGLQHCLHPEHVLRPHDAHHHAADVSPRRLRNVPMA
eukprot:EG_transcript_28789